MILHIFSVRDRATDQFGNPMFLVNQGHAIRSFSDQVNSRSTKEDPNPLNQHPEDFDLYALGSFDTDTGRFSCHDPKQISIGKSVLL